MEKYIEQLRKVHCSLLTVTSVAHLSVGDWWWLSAELAELNPIMLKDMIGDRCWVWVHGLLQWDALHLLKERLNLQWTSRTIQLVLPLCRPSQTSPFLRFASRIALVTKHQVKICVTINNHSSCVIISSLYLCGGRRGGNWNQYSSGYTVTCWAGILSM